jgi:phage baseplate assembly protein gpV
VRTGPHHIGTTGAADGQALIYDRALDEYRPQAIPAAGVQAVVAGTNVTVDNTDPLHPRVSAASGEMAVMDGITNPPELAYNDAGDDFVYMD